MEQTISNSELKIIEIFEKNIFSKITRQEIKNLINTKSENELTTSLKKLTEKKILNLEKIGKTNLYTYNLNHGLKYLNLIHINKFETLPNQIKEICFKILDLQTKFDFTLLIFGSYAKQTQTKNSDLDILILIDENNNIKPYLEEIKLKSIIELDYNIILKQEYIEMLENTEFNLGKESFKNKTIMNNVEGYYSIIKRCKIYE